MPEEVERTYQVGLAIVALDGLFQDPLDAALRSSWRAGTSVTRYGRTWHLARMHADSPTVVTGEIGFVSENTVQTMFFDYATGEFVSGEVPGGVRVPFSAGRRSRSSRVRPRRDSRARRPRRGIELGEGQGHGRERYGEAEEKGRRPP